MFTTIKFDDRGYLQFRQVGTTQTLWAVDQGFKADPTYPETNASRPALDTGLLISVETPEVGQPLKIEVLSGVIGRGHFISESTVSEIITSDAAPTSAE